MINLKYKNKKLEKICNDEKEMRKYFNNDKMLIENLQALLFLFDNEDSIYNFSNKIYLKGYNFEKITNTKFYSMRIVPKKDKRKNRIILLIVSSDGKEIEIIDFDDEHRYRL